MSKQQTVNLDTYSLSLLTAKEDILNPRSSTNWALFAYDGVTNKLKLADSGAGGVTELAGKFHISKAQYGLCKLETADIGGPRIVMINWVGQNVDDYRRTECASHIPAIKNFFKEAHVFIHAEKVEDVTEETIRAELTKTSGHVSSQWARRSSRSSDSEDIVGTNYRKTNAAMEMRLINRDSFWARAEREEEERKDEERRRAAEERRRLERERVLKERRDAEERDRIMDEKLQKIEEQRRKEAEQEEALRRKENFKWEQQQKEHEEDMRARLRRSESIEKAAEAAALVSQRSMNPREFFRQLSSSSSQSPTSPGSSRTGKPFRRYQRSLTDTAFIFAKAEESAASSPHSSPLVSPFSRAPPSPFYPVRVTSPPTSPDFRPVSSPLRPKAPVSPPTSPVRPAPSPQTINQFQAIDEPKAPSPIEPSAPPASPTLLVSFSPTLVKNNLSHLHSEALPASPPNTPNQQVHTAFCFESGPAPQAPTAPLPERPQPNTDLISAPHVHTVLVSDVSYIAQAVLVEEDEEEDMEEHEEEHEEEKTETQPQPLAVIPESVHSEAEEQEQEGEEKEMKEQEMEDDQEVMEEEEEEEEESKQEAGPAEEVLQEEETVTEDQEHNDELEDTEGPAEPAEFSENEEESVVTAVQHICQEIKHETVVLSTNVITNGQDTQEENGIERSLSPSDTELSSQDLVVCYNVHVTPEDEDAIEDEHEEQEISENGKEVLAEHPMCVRALYDYQAEDESEISFEPGDIITDVEMVDRSWWRGWSKNGRQGLFPANYVETI